MVINPIVGVYISIIRIPIKGGRSPIPNIATFDHGTFDDGEAMLLLLANVLMQALFIGTPWHGKPTMPWVWLWGWPDIDS